jgi:hypothetical protein
VPPAGETFWSRAGSLLRTLTRRPIVLVGWIALAALTVVAQHVIPQPFSALVYPIYLGLAVWLFRRAGR